MALNLDACTQISYSMLDREKTIGRMQIHAPAVGAGLPALTFDSIEQEAVGTFGPLVPGGLWTAIQALTDCPLYGVGIGVGYHETDPLLRVGAGEAEVKGVFQFEDDNGEYTQITIPAILDTVLQSNGRFIDPTNAAVSALITAMLNQAGTADVRSANNLPFLRLNSAWKQTRQSSVSGQRRTG
jgi:hypothetical protein